MAMVLSTLADVAIAGARQELYIWKRIYSRGQFRTAFGRGSQGVPGDKKISEMGSFIMPVKHEQGWCQEC